MKDVRLGVIGVGVMGERHCRVALNLPHVELVGVSDLNEERGRLIADHYETAFYPNYQDLLTQVDAVVVATITPAHYRLASDCLTQGVHVFVEKPIAASVQEAEDLVRMANEWSLVLQVGHIERFNPVLIELKNVLDGLELINVSIRRLSPFDTSKTDVDVIHDLMIHDLDLILNLMGSEMASIGAWGRSVFTEVVDHAVATFSFRDGPVVTLTSSRVTEQKVRDIEIIARGAYVQADLLNKSILIHRRTFPQYVNGGSTAKYHQESIIERIYVPASEPLMLELRHFVDCVREESVCQVPGIDGLRALQLAELVTDKISLQTTQAQEEPDLAERGALPMDESSLQQAA